MTYSNSSDSKDSLYNWQDFDTGFNQSLQPIPYFRNALTNANKILKERFQQEVPVDELVHQRAQFIDQLLIRAWLSYLTNNTTPIALVAVGGYGRGELHPSSDIDLLILLDNNDQKQHDESIEKFLMLMWDIGLEVGHSVRTINDCIQQAKNDITVVTNLMEARLIHGNAQLFEEMKQQVGPDHIWSGREFFQAKLDEQIARHHRFGDTAYNLEPNIKENPGGLRDIQVIGWVAKRHFDATTLHDLVNHGFLSEDEYHTLIFSQNFLWKIRFALHVLTGRREDRLLFDNQRILSEQFGYQDSEHRLAVEHFMKEYYRTVMELNRLNEMLLQLFNEVILNENEKVEVIPINSRFQSRNGYIEVINEKIFTRYPFALLEIFLIMQQHAELKGVRAETIRLIRSHTYLINEKFRNDLRCNSLFMEIFRQPRGLTHELRRMNRYGILAAYLPEFANIVGQMQHDLFHVYTVDEHTMFLVRNLRRFTVKEFEHEFPLCSSTIKTIPKLELLYIAGLFHDIAKGRGGDHSTLGAQDAIAFCQHHGLSTYDTNLVAWLVRNHLYMSTTAQRRDISDPDVIFEFANFVGSQEKLDYLYLITVADIRATSPSLWNAWKNSLLLDLYYAASRAYRRGLGNPESLSERITESKNLAREKLLKQGVDENRINEYWSYLEDDYFIRYSVDEIVWHASAILDSKELRLPIILVREQTQRGGTELFVCAKDVRYVFATITATLGRLGLSITDARIATSRLGYTLDTFIVLEKDGGIITDRHRIDEIINELDRVLVAPDIKYVFSSTANLAVPRQLKHFPLATRVLFQPDEKNQRTIMEVVARDHPGLLAKIAAALVKCDVRLQNAKIATFGERAEDIFFITNKDQTPIDDENRQDEIKTEIINMVMSTT